MESIHLDDRSLDLQFTPVLLNIALRAKDYETHILHVHSMDSREVAP